MTRLSQTLGHFTAKCPQMMVCACAGEIEWFCALFCSRLWLWCGVWQCRVRLVVTTLDVVGVRVQPEHKGDGCVAKCVQMTRQAMESNQLFMPNPVLPCLLVQRTLVQRYCGEKSLRHFAHTFAQPSHTAIARDGQQQLVVVAKRSPCPPFGAHCQPPLGLAENVWESYHGEPKVPATFCARLQTFRASR